MIFADWLDTAQGVVTLVTAISGLIGTGVGTFFAIKGGFKAFKNKNAAEQWTLIMSMADAAMKEAEASGKAGADKKAMVIDSVKAACNTAGIDASAFIDQLSDYIDQTITLVNSLNK